jgi:P27 family predicted phage terminase small subunit
MNYGLSDEQKKRQGTFRKHRAKPGEEVPVVPGMPPMPSELTKVAQKEWHRVAPVLFAHGIITENDGAGLAAYCQSYARWLQAEKDIKQRGILVEMTVHDSHGKATRVVKKNPSVGIANSEMKLMKSFAAEYGLTPASRNRVRATGMQETDVFSDF